MIINKYCQQRYAYYSGIRRELQIDDVKGKYSVSVVGLGESL